MKVLYISGYTDDFVMRRGLLKDDVAFLSKPFTAPQLIRQVREVLDAKAPGAFSVRRQRPESS